jgi:hypothetical protein
MNLARIVFATILVLGVTLAVPAMGVDWRQRVR